MATKNIIKLAPLQYQIQNLDNIVDNGGDDFDYNMQILWPQTTASNIVLATAARFLERNDFTLGGTYSYDHLTNTTTFTDGTDSVT
jgi:hypothetical protein